MTELEEFVAIDHDTEFLTANVADILEHVQEGIHLSRIVVIEIFSFFSSKTDFRFEFLVKTYVYAGNFSLIQ